MHKELIVWSLLGAIAISAIYPQAADARRRRGFSQRRQAPSVFRPVRHSRIASRPYYRPVSLLAQIDRSGAPTRQSAPEGERTYRPSPRREAPRARQQTQVARRIPFEGAQEYGVEGSITAAEANVLKYIDFSRGQTYHDLKSRIGFPKYRNGNTDYYEVDGGWMAIDYKDGKAYGHKTIR